jgi:hypothetical protein
MAWNLGFRVEGEGVVCEVSRVWVARSSVIEVQEKNETGKNDIRLDVTCW